MNKYPKSSPDERPLKTLRKSQGLTQPKLAELVGCSATLIRNYEAGQKTPSFDRAVALARSLNVSLKQLAQAMNIDITGVPNDEPRDTI